MSNRKQLVTATAVVALAAAAACATPTVDGVLDAEYGSPIVTQTLQTKFGDSNLGQIDYANGSELDGAYAKVSAGHLYLMLTGNLEGGSNTFNKLDIFVDSIPAQGQNTLRTDNPDIDFNGLNRMGGPFTFNDQNNNPVTQPGLKFDAPFKADRFIGVTGGGGPSFQTYLNYSEILTAGGGNAAFLGGGVGTTVAGSNGINLALNNSNTAGVTAGTGPASGAGVTTGIELDIPLSVLGSPAGLIKIAAFVNGGGHDFLSNQVLGTLPDGYDNLGEPRTVDFSSYPGKHYFIVYLTTPGDANSNGTIDADDFARIDTGFAQYNAGTISPFDAAWTDGDFNGDGVVDQADYLLIDTSYGHQTGAFSPQFLADRQSEFGTDYVNALLASVPEPDVASLATAAFLGSLRRRRA